MSNFENFRYTELGRQLSLLVQAGEAQMDLRYLAIGNGSWTSAQISGAPPDQLVSEKMRVDISSAQVDGDTVVVRGLFENTELTEGFHVTELAVIAMHPTLGPIVYMIDYVGLSAASYVPDRTGAEWGLELEAPIISTTASAIAMQINKRNLGGSDQQSFFNECVSGLLPGTLTGSEGRWQVVATVSVTVTARVIRDFFGLTLVRLQASAVFPKSLSLGTLSKIDPAFRIILFGDSGQPYTGYHLAWDVTEGVAYMDFLPFFKDFRFDITEGKSYTCHVCCESTEIADAMVGEKSFSETFIGSDLTPADELAAIMPAGHYGSLNVGYKNGKVFQSQLLTDADFDGETGLLSLVLSEIPISFQAVEVLNAAKEWVTWTRYIDSWGDSVWSYSSSNVKMFFDLASSYASHGFQSVEDMRNRSAIRPQYHAKSRHLRPINNPENVQIIGGHAYIYNGNYNSEGRRLVQELIGVVPSGSTQLGKWTPITTQLKFTDSSKVWELSYDPVVPRNATANPTVVMVFGQYVEGGTYRIAVWFKELVYDPDTGDHGDDGKFYIVDGMIYILDQNGNYVLAGCMGYDTGIAITD